jgi:hypothetical protein
MKLWLEKIVSFDDLFDLVTICLHFWNFKHHIVIDQYLNVLYDCDQKRDHLIENLL